MKKYVVCSLLCFCVLFQSNANGPQQDTTIVLKWLDTTQLSQSTGVSWGVPFPKGKVKKNQSFSLTTADGKTVPVQSWPLAYWPDGSLKWSGFATVAGIAGGPLKLNLDKAKTVPAVAGIIVKEDVSAVRINAGLLQCVIPKSGSILLDSIMVEGRLVGGDGRLECILQNGPDGEDLESPSKERYRSRINKVTVEQTGPIRAVVRLQGVMRSEKGERSWLPFDIRLYFYKDAKNVRLVDTVIYDGDDSKDFIKGLGMVFSVPLHEEMHNRHIRLAGEGTGIWAEPVRPLVGRYPFMLKGQPVFPEQQAGKPIAGLDQFWMASDPRNPNLFTRTGIFGQYDSLLLYYVGFGGNTNTTTRFRKYNGKGDRVLYTDLKDKEHLLQPNKEYTITTIVYNGVTKFFMDGKEFFSFNDPDPLREGYFGFRTTQSRHEIDDFKVYRLK